MIEILNHDDRWEVLVDGQLFTEYRFGDRQKPYFFPVFWPQPNKHDSQLATGNQRFHRTARSPTSSVAMDRHRNR